MSTYQDLTDPTSKRLAPSTLAMSPKRGQTDALIAEHEARYLYELAQAKGDFHVALHAAGYHPADPSSAREMHYQLVKRINECSDTRSVLIAAGMGIVEWVMSLSWLMQQPEAKYRAVGLKLWGVPLGIYAQQEHSQGAGIHVHVHQAPPQQGFGQANGIVSISVDARRRELPEHSGDEAER